MKKIIVFDLDGVLFDSPKLVNRMLFDLYPTMTTEKVQQILSGNFHEEIEKFKKENPRITMTDDEKNAYFEKYTQDKVSTSLYPGIKELISSLHAIGYILTISTSAFEKNTLPMLQKTGIISMFDYIATAEVSKSKIEKFKIIEDRFVATKDNIIFITDTVGDIREAQVAGVKTIAVTWGGQEKNYILQETSNNLVAVVDTVNELMDKITEILPVA